MPEFKVLRWSRTASRVWPMRVQDVQIDELFIKASNADDALVQALSDTRRENPDPRLRAYVQITEGQGLGDYALLRYVQDQENQIFIDKQCS